MSAGSSSTRISRAQKGRELLGLGQGGAVLPLEVAAPPGAGAGARRGRSATPRPTPISHSRPRDSRIGAWASKQSRPLESRFALEKAVAVLCGALRHRRGAAAAYWSGFRVQPLAIEFWQDRPFRLHERLAFERPDLRIAQWAQTRLYP